MKFELPKVNFAKDISVNGNNTDMTTNMLYELFWPLFHFQLQPS